MDSSVKVGLFGIGLETYWGQFEGLLQQLEGYQSDIADHLRNENVQVIDAGMVDTIDKAHQAADLFMQEDVSLIFLYISTYALSATVLPVVRHTQKPVVVLNLQPTKAIDYSWFNSLNDRGKMTGEWLANCQACAAPEVANVFHRSGIDFFLVTGTLQDSASWQEISDWAVAAKVMVKMARNRVGLMGHYYNGMLDIYTDLTAQTAVFGSYIQHIEMCELKTLLDGVTRQQIEVKIKQIYSEFDVLKECLEKEVQRAAKTAVALDKLAEKFQLGSLCYYYEGTPDSEYEDIISSVIVGNSLLTAHKIPVAGEYEVKNVQAMKIMDLFDAGGSFTEFYGMDFNDDIILMGHDGPGHLAIAEGKPLLKPLNVYHGKPGNGLSVEMRVKHGPVTLMSVVEDTQHSLKILVAEGEAVPGPILEIGNTNSRYRFSLDIKTFMDKWCGEGPAHHCAVGVGHISAKLEKLGKLLQIPVVKIC